MFRFRLSMILLVLALLTGTGVLAQAPDGALVRFTHAIPGAAAVDIYADGQLAATNLDFGETTVYINLSAGQHQVAVTPVGATTALWEQLFTPGAGRAYTLVASSFDEPVEFVPFEDLLDPCDLLANNLSIRSKRHLLDQLIQETYCRQPCLDIGSGSYPLIRDHLCWALTLLAFLFANPAPD